jgi:hypothetical protein
MIEIRLTGSATCKMHHHGIEEISHPLRVRSKKAYLHHKGIAAKLKVLGSCIRDINRQMFKQQD